MWIYETDNWTKFVWDKDIVTDRLLAVNKKAGFLWQDGAGNQRYGVVAGGQFQDEVFQYVKPNQR